MTGRHDVNGHYGPRIIAPITSDSYDDPARKRRIVQLRCHLDEEDATNCRCRPADNGKGLKWKLIRDSFEEALEKRARQPAS
ncbi:hypothetical protein AVEN_214824-1 [Araneus ventricosus]|uniref:Uncharacterized protein n=1 Tax=Araneus ventricosus TaxID=182803 RepID=A0A4Y2EJC5_ARAVE|nr:hypothetical protein AVEN_214824-1 [Araneus ventricosus]